ncbi:MAG: hypothetical protein JO022_00240 [Acidobacteriaceae bacterium]|nr:hypothetical protein [Acidobacteriaceae bacterium]
MGERCLSHFEQGGEGSIEGESVALAGAFDGGETFGFGFERCRGIAGRRDLLVDRVLNGGERALAALGVDHFFYEVKLDTVGGLELGDVELADLPFLVVAGRGRCRLFRDGLRCWGLAGGGPRGGGSFSSLFAGHFC